MTTDLDIPKDSDHLTTVAAEATTETGKPSTIRRAFWISFVVCSIATAIFLLVTKSNRMLDVDRSVLEQSRGLWDQATISDYEVRIAVTTSGTDIYEVTVRENEAQQVLLNGVPLHRRHAFDTWTVVGMLDTIAIDIEHCERWDEGRATPGTCDLMIKATFDPSTGLPRKYIRMELGRPSSVGVMDWKITRFTPLPKLSDTEFEN